MRMMMNAAMKSKRARRSGFSLVEIAMVLAIVALLVAGVMLFFSSAANAQKTNDAMTELAAVQMVVRSMYSGQPDYLNLTSTILAGSGQLPAKWVKSASLLSNPFNSLMTVAETNSSVNFYVTFNGVPVAACTKMVTTDFGTSLISVSANTTTVTARAMTPTEANGTTACVAGNSNVVSWVFL